MRFGALPADFGRDHEICSDLPSAVSKYWKAMSSGGSTGRPKIIVDHMPSVCDPSRPDHAWNPRARRVLAAFARRGALVSGFERVVRTALDLDVEVHSLLSYMDIVFAEDDLGPELRAWLKEEVAVRTAELAVFKCPSDGFNGAENRYERGFVAGTTGNHSYARGNYGMNMGVNRNCFIRNPTFGPCDDPFVTDGHASFQVRGGRLVLVDGGAASGVYVSVPPVTVVQPGQYFAVGLQVFRFLGPLQGPGPEGVFGAPFPRRAYRVEHVLVGDRSGRVVLFRYSASVGRRRGTFQFPDDEQLEEVHAELRPGPGGMELVTHARQSPVFMRVASGADVPLQNGDLVRFGTSTLRVVART